MIIADANLCIHDAWFGRLDATDNAYCVQTLRSLPTQTEAVHAPPATKSSSPAKGLIAEGVGAGLAAARPSSTAST